MKLISTLRYSANKAAPASTGNYGGDLRLFFSTLNQADFVSTPSPLMWQGHGKGTMDTYTLPSGDVIEVNLNLVSQQYPGELYIYGMIAVTTPSGIYFNQPLGNADQVFLPGKPVLAMLKGTSQLQSGALTFGAGFELVVPWDGVSADCHGSWWVEWH